MNNFLPKGWLKEEKLISVSLIVSLHNNKLSRRLGRRHPGFVFFRGNDTNAPPSANIATLSYWETSCFNEAVYATRETTPDACL